MSLDLTPPLFTPPPRLDLSFVSLPIGVKSRLVINALLEQFRFFLLPFFQRLNGRKMVERTLRNLLVFTSSPA